VRDDGEDLLATCAQAGEHVTEATWFVDETDGRLRDALVAARPGDLLGPVPIDQGFVLIAVLSKVLPVESDPEVRQRAERALLDRLVTREIQDRVTWHEKL
jgi:parvulin-like peptidyl-prolyl isomerase